MTYNIQLVVAFINFLLLLRLVLFCPSFNNQHNLKIHNLKDEAKPAEVNAKTNRFFYQQELAQLKTLKDIRADQRDEDKTKTKEKVP